MVSKASLIARSFGGGGAFSQIADKTIAAGNRKLSASALGDGVGGMQTFANMAALVAHTGMSAGDQALVTALNKMFVYTGSGWFLIATVTNSSPTDITGVAGTYALAVDGTATTITAISTDPEGFPLTWSYAVTTGSLGSTATVSQADNVFTITPSSTEADGGTFSITFSVTDGATGAVSVVSAFSLEFSTPMNVSTAGSGLRMVINANSTTGALDISARSGASDILGVGYVPTTGLKLGKHYIELDITSSLAAPNKYLLFGIGDLAMAQAGSLGWNDGGNVVTAFYANSPRFYPGASNSNLSTISDGNLHTLMWAYDTTAERVWFGVDGTWDSSTNTGGAPGTGAGIDISGVNFSTGLTFIFGDALGSGDCTAQFVSGAGQTLTYTVPTGFNAY